MNKTDEDNENLLHYLAQYGTQSMLNFALEKLKSELSNENLKEFLLTKSKGGSSFINFALNNENLNHKQIFEFFEENFPNECFENFVKFTNEDEGNLLEFCSLNGDLNLSDCLWKTYKRNFSSVETFEILDGNDKLRNIFLHVANFNIKSEEDLEKIFEQINFLISDKKIFKEFLLSEGLFGRNALHVSIWKKNEILFLYLFEKIYCKLFKFEEFIYKMDKNDKNFLHFLAEFGSEKMINFALNKLKNKFSDDELIKFIKLKSRQGCNLLHLAAVRKNESSLKIVFDFIKNELGENEFKEFLCEKNADNDIPLQCAGKFNTAENFRFILSIYRNIFTQAEIVKNFQIRPSEIKN
jgi:hypothetical protein